MFKKFIIIAFIVVAGISLLKVVEGTFDRPAWADANSLAQQKPSQTDLDVFYTALNKTYGVNWSDLVRYQMQAVNWVAIGFVQPTGGVNGGVNWTMPNAYVGG
jgi:hypothetical protein